MARRLPSADQLTQETLSDPGTGKSLRWKDPSSPMCHRMARRSVAAVTIVSVWLNKSGLISSFEFGLFGALFGFFCTYYGTLLDYN